MTLSSNALRRSAGLRARLLPCLRAGMPLLGPRQGGSGADHAGRAAAIAFGGVPAQAFPRAVAMRAARVIAEMDTAGKPGRGAVYAGGRGGVVVRELRGDE